MKHKKGFLGIIFLGITLIILFIFLFLYFQIKTHGLTISTGNIVVKINYNDSDKEQDKRQDIPILEENMTSYNNISYEYENLTNQSQ